MIVPSRRLQVVVVALAVLPTISPAARGQSAPLPSRPASSIQDQLATYVAEASQRFGVPEAWIAAIIRVESAGDPTVTSTAGAMGLMQIMPTTYATLRARLGLGANPYDPHDNIMAGAAYLREMHDRYGTIGFLAAYNAGPGRWEDHLAGVRPLPPETMRYVARLAPMLDEHDAIALARAISPVAVTPATAPIFVALGMTSRARSSLPPMPTSVQLAAGSTPGERQLAEIFVARSAAAGLQPTTSSNGEKPVQLPSVPRASGGDPVPRLLPSNALFVSRQPSQEQQ